MAKPIHASMASGPNLLIDGRGFSFSLTHTQVTVLAASLSPRCSAWATWCMSSPVLPECTPITLAPAVVSSFSGLDGRMKIWGAGIKRGR